MVSFLQLTVQVLYFFSVHVACVVHILLLLLFIVLPRCCLTLSTYQLNRLMRAPKTHPVAWTAHLSSFPFVGHEAHLTPTLLQWPWRSPDAHISIVAMTHTWGPHCYSCHDAHLRPTLLQLPWRSPDAHITTVAMTLTWRPHSYSYHDAHLTPTMLMLLTPYASMSLNIALYPSGPLPRAMEISSIRMGSACVTSNSGIPATPGRYNGIR